MSRLYNSLQVCISVCCRSYIKSCARVCARARACLFPTLHKIVQLSVVSCKKLSCVQGDTTGLTPHFSLAAQTPASRDPTPPCWSPCLAGGHQVFEFVSA